uniref:Uncharacterized protein n=1 Tax=Megaviridae environmental sample TaxID=1737588 RepID=A0A5J6VIT5_9VIRU|nr:MAG: hypothetical protein [Megaviridae environmental sample]
MKETSKIFHDLIELKARVDNIKKSPKQNEISKTYGDCIQMEKRIDTLYAHPSRKIMVRIIGKLLLELEKMNL